MAIQLSKKQQGILFAVVMIGVIAGFSALGMFTMFKKGPSADGAVVADAAEKEDLDLKKVNVLFIGNSYTYFNDMPKTLMAIAKEDVEAKLRLNVKVVAKGGTNLTEQWNEGLALQTLGSEKWDFVVLQEQSFWAMDDVNVSNTRAAVNNFVNAIKPTGAKILLFESWPRQAGSNWYKDLKYALALRNPDYMLQKFRVETANLAQAVGAGVVPVGDYWVYALKQNPQLALYNADGSHPSAAGSFFTALLFYRYFTGRTFEDLSYAPDGVDKAAAKSLKEIASIKSK